MNLVSQLDRLCAIEYTAQDRLRANKYTPTGLGCTRCVRLVRRSGKTIGRVASTPILSHPALPAGPPGGSRLPEAGPSWGISTSRSRGLLGDLDFQKQGRLGGFRLPEAGPSWDSASWQTSWGQLNSFLQLRSTVQACETIYMGDHMHVHLLHACGRSCTPVVETPLFAAIITEAILRKGCAQARLTLMHHMTY
eukprot:jgi/Botrbrau1/19190/Bobra.0077s0096.1